MNNRKSHGKLIDELDALFVMCSDAYEGEGEDSYCCSYDEDAALIGVFDGCGGLGARQYDKYDNHTGAYMASRLVSGAVYDWFQSLKKRKNHADPSEELKPRIEKALSQGKEMGGSTLVLRGSMVRDFPTTAAIVLVEHQMEKTMLNAIWAGDSRVYIWDQNGLSQFSKDDTDISDAYESLRKDPVLTNVLSSDGNFTLRSRKAEIKGPIAVLACTDGYFGYWQTPMHFEYFLLETLEKADSLSAWKRALHSEIQEITGDDATLAIMLLRFETFKDLKNCCQKRYALLQKQYIQPLSDSYTEEKALKLWQEYRIGYERYIG